MASKPRPWTVLPSSPVEPLEPNLRVVKGSLPSGQIPRTMMVARFNDGRLVFFNAIPMSDAEMQSLESWGTPAFLIVPSPYHRLDIHAFKVRYPNLKVLCAREFQKKISEVVPVDGDIDDLPKDANVKLIRLRGTKGLEPLLAVTNEGRTTICMGDAVMNIPHLKGFEGFLLRLLGSTGGPKVTLISKLLLVSDGAVLRSELETLSRLQGLARLVPSHGDMITGDIAATLRSVAQRL